MINTPSRVDTEVRGAREILQDRATRSIRTEARAVLDELRARDDAWKKEHEDDPSYVPGRRPPLTPTYFQTLQAYEAKKLAIPDPTTLILVDEADRLTMPSLEQLRSIFDESRLGLILIGMPGIEKRAARYPQFFSRIGFVHEFRTLAPAEVKSLLQDKWAVIFEPPSSEVVAAVIRITDGNFRLTRLLTQAERVARINDLALLTPAVIEAARMNLVIGQA